jgi:phosphoenolpyruvate carboxylase
VSWKKEAEQLARTVGELERKIDVLHSSGKTEAAMRANLTRELRAVRTLSSANPGFVSSFTALLLRCERIAECAGNDIAAGQLSVNDPSFLELVKHCRGVIQGAR